MCLAFAALLDDDSLAAVMVVMATPALMTPALVPAVVTVLDDDCLADVAVAHTVMIAMMSAFADFHLHVLRGRRSRERGYRKGQRRNGGSRESKFPHVLLLEAGACPRARAITRGTVWGSGFPKLSD
jgi:hypothetical protein